MPLQGFQTITLAILWANTMCCRPVQPTNTISNDHGRTSATRETKEEKNMEKELEAPLLESQLPNLNLNPKP